MVLILVRKQVATVEWIFELKTPVFVFSRQVVGAKGPNAEGVQLHQRRITVGMVIFAGAMCIRVPLGQEGINQNAAVLSRIQHTKLRNSIHHAAAARAARQAAAHMKGQRGFHTNLHLTHQGLHLRAELGRPAGEEQPSQSPFLTAHVGGGVG